jgi:hypothetical protein
MCLDGNRKERGTDRGRGAPGRRDRQVRIGASTIVVGWTSSPSCVDGLESMRLLADSYKVDVDPDGPEVHPTSTHLLVRRS